MRYVPKCLFIYIWTCFTCMYLVITKVLIKNTCKCIHHLHVALNNEDVCFEARSQISKTFFIQTPPFPQLLPSQLVLWAEWSLPTRRPCDPSVGGVTQRRCVGRAPRRDAIMRMWTLRPWWTIFSQTPPSRLHLLVAHSVDVTLFARYPAPLTLGAASGKYNTRPYISMLTKHWLHLSTKMLMYKISFSLERELFIATLVVYIHVHCTFRAACMKPNQHGNLKINCVKSTVIKTPGSH